LGHSRESGNLKTAVSLVPASPSHDSSGLDGADVRQENRKKDSHMSYIFDRNQALELLKTHIKNENLIKHCLASEAILRALGERLGEDVEKWGYTGLIHDMDYEVTEHGVEKHGHFTARLLKQMDCPEDVVHAVMAHDAENSGVPRESVLDFAITCGEAITGLIIATALILPDKKIASVKAKSVKKRMKETAFARSVNREDIRRCEAIGIPLEDFIELSLNAMVGIADNLGL